MPIIREFQPGVVTENHGKYMQYAHLYMHRRLCCVYVWEPAAAPSGWQGPLINELSRPRGVGRVKRPRFCVSLRFYVLSHPGCRLITKSFSRCFTALHPVAAVPKSPSWHCVCDTSVWIITFLETLQSIQHKRSVSAFYTPVERRTFYGIFSVCIPLNFLLSQPQLLFHSR